MGKRPSVFVVIPTVDGRQDYLHRCIRGYDERSDGADVRFIILENRPSCGVAWQEGADKAEQLAAEGWNGLHPGGGHLHLTADDIVPGEGWVLPLLEATDRGYVPVAAVVNCDPTVLEDEFPKPGNPITENTFFFEGPGSADPFSDYPDWSLATDWRREETAYPSVPFCSMRQWDFIGPMIASHYGTDKWFGYRARLAGFEPVVRHGSIFYHYTAEAGRKPAADGWHQIDRLTFEQNIAYPMYVNGQLAWHETHPLFYTDEGLALTREWYRTHVARPAEGYYFEQEA